MVNMSMKKNYRKNIICFSIHKNSDAGFHEESESVTAFKIRAIDDELSSFF